MNVETVTRKEVENWARDFNEIPTFAVAKLAALDIESIREITETDDEYAEFLPMWNTMWTVRDLALQEWIKNNPEIMQECGFRVYESDAFEVIFGIDGAGYDFYSAHWIPLYKAYYGDIEERLKKEFGITKEIFGENYEVGIYNLVTGETVTIKG